VTSESLTTPGDSKTRTARLPAFFKPEVIRAWLSLQVAYCNLYYYKFTRHGPGRSESRVPGPPFKFKLPLPSRPSSSGTHFVFSCTVTVTGRAVTVLSVRLAARATDGQLAIDSESEVC
jgi:hypothetical protein